MPLEILVGAAVGAAVASPTLRKKVRRGLLYGVAGVLIAYDKVAAAASKVRGSHKDASEPAEPAAAEAASPTVVAGSVKQPAAATQSIKTEEASASKLPGQDQLPASVAK